jgi:hypothetical protein
VTRTDPSHRGRQLGKVLTPTEYSFGAILQSLSKGVQGIFAVDTGVFNSKNKESPEEFMGKLRLR